MQTFTTLALAAGTQVHSGWNFTNGIFTMDGKDGLPVIFNLLWEKKQTVMIYDGCFRSDQGTLTQSRGADSKESVLIALVFDGELGVNNTGFIQYSSKNKKNPFAVAIIRLPKKKRFTAIIKRGLGPETRVSVSYDERTNSVSVISNGNTVLPADAGNARPGLIRRIIGGALGTVAA